MSYLVLARKWRPQTFDDLVGQSHVSRTLANAIATDRVAHAFLFTGVRGVGKTTSARILAKALSCAKGPTASPCLVCPACMEIAAGSDVDVQEIDAASYTGVDDIRRLQETLPYRPQRDRFKIYIVDEVHMLSANAWNAFLKTLEEPPPHVKFIFATTEVHKVPVTILSRCQRYDFKLIGTQTIAKRLREVLAAEAIVADDAAVQIVAREAAGSMRDAMSLLDQAIAWGGSNLVGEEVARVLGVAGRGVLAELARALVVGDAEECLRVLARLADDGFDLVHVARDLLAHLRDLVVSKVCKEPGDLLDLPDDEARAARAIADTVTVDDLVRLHQGFARSFDDVARSGQPRAALEMALVRIARRPALLPVDDLVAKLADLERRLGGGGPSRGPSGGGRPMPAGPPPRAPGPSGPAPTSHSPAPARGPMSSVSSSSASSSAARAVASVPHAAPAPQAAPARPEIASVRAPETREAPAPAPIVEAAPAAPVDLAAWRVVLDVIRAERPPLASVFEHAAPLAFGPDRVVLGFEANSFLASKAAEASDLLTRVIRAHFGRPTVIDLDVSGHAPAVASVATIEQAEHRARVEAERRRVADHPVVRAAIEALDGELREVRLPREPT